MNYVILGIGIWMIIMLFFTTVENTLSKVLWKLIPALSGLILIIYSIKMLGWI